MAYIIIDKAIYIVQCLKVGGKKWCGDGNFTFSSLPLCCYSFVKFPGPCLPIS